MAEEQVEQDFQGILKNTVMSALHTNLLAKGLHEVCKAIETKNAQFCILADDCDEPTYKKLVIALCKENDIPYVSINEGYNLGEWLGLCKYDVNKNIRKKRKCSSVAIKQFPTDLDENARKLIQDHFQH